LGITAADYVQGVFGGKWLPAAVALTGIVATMPYIALQLVGMQVVIKSLGVTGELPLIIAFVILALYTSARNGWRRRKAPFHLGILRHRQARGSMGKSVRTEQFRSRKRLPHYPHGRRVWRPRHDPLSATAPSMESR
jgi:hypothetical protein